MKQRSLTLMALPLLVWSLSPAEATTINYVPGVLNAPSDAIYQDFEGFPVGVSPSLGWWPVTLADNPSVVDTVSGGSVLGTGEVGNHYVAIPAGGVLSLTFSTPGYYFGLLWGTVDGFNSITFFDGGQEIATFTGFDLQESPDHTSAIYANFYATGGTFTSVAFFTTDGAFEFDNVRVAPTPLPAALGMFGVAVVGMGALGLRRRPA